MAAASRSSRPRRPSTMLRSALPATRRTATASSPSIVRVVAPPSWSKVISASPRRRCEGSSETKRSRPVRAPGPARSPATSAAGRSRSPAGRRGRAGRRRRTGARSGSGSRCWRARGAPAADPRQLEVPVELEVDHRPHDRLDRPGEAVVHVEAHPQDRPMAHRPVARSGRPAGGGKGARRRARRLGGSGPHVGLIGEL